MLVVVCGLPGAGKSQVAKLIAQKIKAIHLQTDVLRQNRAFSPRAQKTYQILFEKAEENLKLGKSVVLDGTFYSKKLRNQAKKLARKLKVKIQFVEVICEEHKIKSRIKKRLKKGTSESKAPFLAYLKIRKLWEPIKQNHIVIDNSRTKKWLKEQIDKLTL